VTLCAHDAPLPEADVVLLTVNDDNVAATAARLPVGPIVLHTAGALGLDVLEPHVRRGSLHPLMSFPGPERGVPPTDGVPAAIAGHPEALVAARALAERLGFRVFEVPGDRRLYHAAAVMAGNYATVLLDAASTLLAAAGVHPALAPSLLAPLALASVEQGAKVGPARALTGPLARGDAQAVAAQLETIDVLNPELAALYRAIGAWGLQHTLHDAPLTEDQRAALWRALGVDAAPR
jgi:predicted short-subunit dehydrogenase-like oxidoreductase (DUF2520 family)